MQKKYLETYRMHLVYSYFTKVTALNYKFYLIKNKHDSFRFSKKNFYHFALTSLFFMTLFFCNHPVYQRENIAKRFARYYLRRPNKS